MSLTETVMVTASPGLDGAGWWLRILTSNTPIGKVGVTVGVDVLVGVLVVGVKVAVWVGVRVGVFVGVWVGVLVGVEGGTGPTDRKLNASTSFADKPHVLPSK